MLIESLNKLMVELVKILFTRETWPAMKQRKIKTKMDICEMLNVYNYRATIWL